MSGPSERRESVVRTRGRRDDGGGRWRHGRALEKEGRRGRPGPGHTPAGKRRGGPLAPLSVNPTLRGQQDVYPSPSCRLCHDLLYPSLSSQAATRT